MTEEEKQSEREYKKEAEDRLKTLCHNLSIYNYALDNTDVRIREYIESVALDTEGHNLYEILGILRFFYLLDKYTWNAKKVKMFFKFYECLKFNGVNGRQSYKLTPVQCFQFANIMGFEDKDGLRLIRDAYIFVPRKFSKTTSASSLAVYDLLFGYHNSQAYIGANSYDQAKICFDEIRNILFSLDPNGRHFRINREKITFKTRERDSLIQCLTANAKTKDGLNASLVIMDEFAQARNTAGKNGSDLKNTLTSSMGARKEPLTVIITTASEVLDGPFIHELEGVMKVLKGEVVNDTVFGALYMPDVDDAEDDPHTWRKVQPHLGITVQNNYYEKEWQRSQLSAENKMTFRTKLLNIFAENESRTWISASLIKDISLHIDFTESGRKRPDAMVAIDLSESDDFSAVSTGVYSYEDKTFTFHTAYFFPRGALDGHPNERLYRIWAEQGHLILTEGDVIDYNVIRDYVLDLNAKVRILGIGYDPWKSQELVNALAASGAKNVLKPLRQTYGYFTAPVESFEHGAKTGHIRIDDNPINAYCFGNAILDFDNLENCKPIKIRQTQKIDGVITVLMCVRQFIDYER